MGQEEAYFSMHVYHDTASRCRRLRPRLLLPPVPACVVQAAAVSAQPNPESF